MDIVAIPAKEHSWTTARLRDALRTKYPPPAYGLLFEVPDGTAGYRNRSADALAMCLYPSRGVDLLGFEIKASRSDWQRELANPDKAEAMCCHCDYWWLVVSDADIVKSGELPRTWGLMAGKEGKGDKTDGLKVIVQAPRLTAEPTGNDIGGPISRALVASIMRRASNVVEDIEGTGASFERGRLAGVKQGIASAKESEILSTSRLRTDYDRLVQALADFESSSGIDINAYTNGNKLGSAVKALLGGHKKLADTFDRIARDSSMLSDLSSKCRDEVRGMMEDK